MNKFHRHLNIPDYIPNINDTRMVWDDVVIRMENYISGKN